LKVLFSRLNDELQGYYNCFGVNGISASLNQFIYQAMWLL